MNSINQHSVFGNGNGEGLPLGFRGGILLTLILLLFSGSESLWAQTPGTVLTQRKISASGLLPLDQSDQLGRSVATLSNLTGGAKTTLLVGAQGDDDGGTNGQSSDVGAVYILRLSTNNTLESVRKISATSGNFTGVLNDKDFFGKAVCNLGDFNGDGVPDVAVGASRDDDGGTARGAVWILFLDDQGAVVSHTKISDTSGNFTGALNDLDEFGSAVSPLGDLDADGTLDLIVGARLDDDGGSGRGAAYILFLQPDGTVREWTKISSTSGGLVGPLSDNDSFGQSVAGIGDLDGDGIPDAVVGATKDDDGANRNGAIWVLFLNRDGTVRAEQKISASAGGFVGPLTGSDEFGNSVSGLGDIDGDGVLDLAVGAIFDQDPSLSTSTGCVWILFMNPDGTVKAEQKINEFEGGFVGDLSDGGEFGEGVHTMGDIDGDGKVDLVVGERFRDDGQPNAGAVWLLHLDGLVAAPVAADFTSSTQGGFWPLSVDFSDTSFGDVRQWSWDFGDGTLSYERNPNHIYMAAGSYTVTLRVEGPVRNDTVVKVGHVVVTDPVLPSVDFSVSPLIVDAGDPVTFTDLSTGSITAWSWDFGDANSSSLQNPVYAYNIDGTYSVTLTATGPAGSDSLTKLDYVVVNTPDPPVAAFSATPQAADAGVSIDFTDESTGLVTAWNWDFGDGTNSSVQNPAHIYDHPGTFDVSLTVSSTGGSDTLTQVGYITILVPPPPVASLQLTPETVIEGRTITFNDTSSGQVLAWDWAFGDGVTSTLQTPTHVYTTPGVYPVSLKVSNDGGFDVQVVPIQVLADNPAGTLAGGPGTVLGTPNPRFTASPTMGVAPLSVFFSDLTAGGPVGWDWDFGDGSTSTLQNPVHSYSSPGTYTVSLSATAASGGTGTTVVDSFIVVLPVPPVADFTADVTTGVAPLDVQFTDLSTSVVDSWVWNFGDGTTSTEQNPLHTYTFGATFSVTLTVTGPGGGDVLTKAAYIVVNEAPPTVDFVADTTTGTVPRTIFFTELAGGVITTYDWDFGDGTTDTAPNPMHTYTLAGSYTVSLTVTGPGGSATETKVDYIVLTDAGPVADFSADVASGTAPLAVTFSDLTTGTVSSWSWDFGDGNTSTLQNPGNTYALAGTYDVSLTATGPGGTDSVTKVGYIVVSDAAPVADFSADVTSGTAPLSVTFSDLTTGTVSSWSWDFGDGNTSTLQNPGNTYALAGTYDVSLTATGPGGTDSVTKIGYILVSNAVPVADFSADVTSGTAPLAVTFSDLTTGAVSSWSWDFGDGNTSTLQNPGNTYALAGTYDVSLTATGPAGTDSVTKVGFITVLEAPPIADFSADVTQGLTPLAVQFTDTSSGSVSSWAWDFGDGGMSSLQSPSYSYLTAGTYTVTLTATGPGGMDSAVKLDFIQAVDTPPSAEFSADVTSGDAPLDVQFTDLSGGVVNAWSWNLGDGSASSQESPFHTYGSPGTFDVDLTVTGPGGMDTNQKLGYIVANTPPPPTADFSADVTAGSVPLSVQFSDLTSGQVNTWSWDFGDGGTSSLANPAFVYNSTGTFTVSLTATGFGGSDTVTKVGYILVTLGPGASRGGFGEPKPNTGHGAPGSDTLPRARWTRRNGSGVNPLVLDAVRAPRLGQELEFKLARRNAREAMVTLLLSDKAHVPLVLTNGELLIDPAGVLLWVSSGVTHGGELRLSRDLPRDLSLAGMEVTAQALLRELDLSTTGGDSQWTNAVDLLLGD